MNGLFAVSSVLNAGVDDRLPASNPCRVRSVQAPRPVPTRKTNEAVAPHIARLEDADFSVIADWLSAMTASRVRAR
jgi:hypothetical protein